MARAERPAWVSFITTDGGRARADHLAHVLGVSVEDVRQVRRQTPGRGPRRSFAELFSRWHGRPPADHEWPVPQRQAAAYEWQPPELAVVARLVGRVAVDEIATVLTRRLRDLTGDAQAERSRNAVQCAIQRLGLQASEVLGGVRITDAARRVGSLAIVQQAVAAGRLRAFRVGRLHVIPAEALDAFLASRDQPPPGWVRLATLRTPLGIKSDKLPEYARLGYVPDAVFVRAQHRWYIAPARARQILEDARTGRPLPWHGQPLPTNLKATWRKWQARKHRRCLACRRAWAPGKAPGTFEDFARRYPWLSLPVKRHLTLRQGIRPTVRRGPQPLTPLKQALRQLGYRLVRIWTLTIPEAARLLGKPEAWVRNRIREGLVRPLRSRDPGAPLRLSAKHIKVLSAARAVERRGRPPGRWLGLHAAAVHAGVSITTVENWRRRRLVTVKRGARGRLYSVRSLERVAQVYWARARFKRVTPPAWVGKAA